MCRPVRCRRRGRYRTVPSTWPRARDGVAAECGPPEDRFCSPGNAPAPRIPVSTELPRNGEIPRVPDTANLPVEQGFPVVRRRPRRLLPVLPRCRQGRRRLSGNAPAPPVRRSA